MADSPTVDLADPSPEEAIEWASAYDAPLHPKYTYCWHDVSVDASYHSQMPSRAPILRPATARRSASSDWRTGRASPSRRWGRHCRTPAPRNCSRCTPNRTTRAASRCASL
ncbi:hypothetical protein [Halapricum sp. CBA1109]|uniref:hypothetical protein n=1 Tax=Halapricum sp. CBA1109 TaxID=2668068 RepID=UPI001E30C19D|nr:hypothetical protein [Halapricum sp. CBA1109]